MLTEHKEKAKNNLEKNFLIMHSNFLKIEKWLSFTNVVFPLPIRSHYTKREMKTNTKNLFNKKEDQKML